MTSQHRRPSQEPFDRYRLRYRFISRLRNQLRYQNIITQDVRPRWRDLSRCAPNLLQNAPTFRSLAYASELAADGDFELDDAAREGLSSYISEVERTARSLGLTWKGDPADWILEFIHADAANQLDPVSEAAINPINHIQITLSVTANGAAIVVSEDSTGEFPTTEIQGTEFPWRQDIPDPSGIAFAEWDELSAAACSLVARWIKSARNATLDQYTYQNPTTLDRQIQRLDRLFNHVVGGKSVREVFPDDDKGDDTLRKRLRRLADYLQLDLPR